MVHHPPQREPARDRRCGRAVRRLLTTSTPYDRHGLVGAAQRARAQRPPDRRRARRARRAGRHGGALPDEQLGPRQRAVPAARATCEHGVRVALGSDVGAGTGLLHCSRRGCTPTSCSSCSATRACGSRPPTCSTSRPRPAPRRSGLADQVGDLASASASTPPGCGRGPGRCSTSPCATPATRRTRWPRPSRWATPADLGTWVDGAPSRPVAPQVAVAAGGGW